MDCIELGVCKRCSESMSCINGMKGMEEFVFPQASRVWKKMVAEFDGIGGQDKDYKEVILESTYGTLCCIVAMDMWRSKLEFTSIFGDGLLEGGTSFIVHNTDGRCLMCCAKTGMLCLVCCNAVGIFFW